MSLDFGALIPFVEHLGFTLEKFEGGESVLYFAPQPVHCNSFGVTHGGAVMTFLDVIMATAARSVQTRAAAAPPLRAPRERPARAPHSPTPAAPAPP